MEIVEFNGKFLIVELVGNSYSAPMNTAGKENTGCHTVFGSLKYVASSPNITKYKTKSGAKNALKKIVDDL